MAPKSPFKKEVYERNAKIYKILANPKRLEILNTIKHDEATVGALADALHMAQSNVSQNLSVLRLAGLVETRRSGHNIFYKIADPRLIEPCTIFNKMFSR